MTDSEIAAKVNAFARGNWPYPMHWLKRRWTTRRPQTFPEKMRYKLLRDRRPILQTFADKIAAREYVRATVGSEYLTDAYVVADQTSDVPWSQLPREFVCKVSHGCGGVVVVWDGADPGARLASDPMDDLWEHVVVRPENVDLEDLCRTLNLMLSRRYGWGWGTQYEWAYKNISPRILIEERLDRSAGGLPADYRVFVFNGNARLIQVDADWLTSSRSRAFFLPDWSRLDVGSGLPQSDISPTRPEHLERMLALAECLAAPTDFLRVDFFDLGDRLVVGELTNYPAGGTVVWSPRSFDSTLGSWWQVPHSYRTLPSVASSHP